MGLSCPSAGMHYMDIAMKSLVTSFINTLQLSIGGTAEGSRAWQDCAVVLMGPDSLESLTWLLACRRKAAV